MSLYGWLLFLHVLAAFALVAAEVLFTFLAVGSPNLDVPSDVAPVPPLAHEVWGVKTSVLRANQVDPGV